MTSITNIIDCLDKTPTILQGLLDQIPIELFKTRRIENKWCIHEQVCHLVEAQGILTSRFTKFETEVNPLIESYYPPDDREPDHYLRLNMDEELENFRKLRRDMVLRLTAFPSSYWDLQGRHEAFTPYNTRLLLTHTLNVDYVHLFSIEQLGLTRPGLEEEIITIP